MAADQKPTPQADGTANSFVPGRVGVVGLGLMGGSFARAFRAAGVDVYAWNRTKSTLELAEIETVRGELDDKTIPTCELIVLAGYPQSAIDWLAEKAGLIADGAIVIDTVGVKRVICEKCGAIAKGRDWTFVGCHPMAGTQYSGFAHSRATMFKGAPMVVVPPEGMDDFERVEILERLKALLAPCQFGSFTLASAPVHDRMIAFTSQLCHVVSNAYVKSPSSRDHHGFSAGSYRDLTRVARLNAPMWSELFLENRENLLFELDTYMRALQAYRDALANRDADALTALLEAGKKAKEDVDG